MAPHLWLAVLLAGAFFIAFVLRIAWVAGDQLELAHRYQQNGDTGRAVISYERAIHAYLPMLPARRQALHDMQALLASLEKRDKALALEGWRRLRSAILYARSIVGQPDRNVLKLANRHIARLAAGTDKQGKMTRQEIEKEAVRLLAGAPKDIRAGWGVTQFLALLTWVISATLLIWFWQDWLPARRWQCAGFGVTAWLFWLFALYMAG